MIKNGELICKMIIALINEINVIFRYTFSKNLVDNQQEFLKTLMFMISQYRGYRSEK